MADDTLDRFIESKWFKGAARGCMILAGLAIPAGVAVYFFLAGDTAAKVVTMSNVQIERARDSENFQREVRGITVDLTDKVDEVDAKLVDVQDDIGLLKVQVGIATGILQDMQRRELATRNLLPSLSAQ